MGVRVREKVKGSGEWWVFVNHKGQRRAKKCGSKKAAEKVKERIEAKLVLNHPLFDKTADPPLPTLATYYKGFERTHMRTTLKRSTYSSYETNFRVHTLPFLGHYRLDEIARTTMEEFVANLMEKELSKTTIRLILSALAVLFNDANEKGLIEKNPARGLGKLYRQAPMAHPEIEPLTEAEALLFLRTTLEYRPRYYPLFLTALHTGLRCGELNGLQRGDVDWSGKFIVVRRSIVKGEISSVKTKNGRRKVDLSDELLKVLKNLHRETLRKALKNGSKIPEWVFANRTGGFVDMDNIKYRNFKAVLRKAGLRDIRFHDLRHSYASLLLSRGGNLLYVSKQLGHSNPQMTLKVYAHWIPGENQRLALNTLPSLQLASGV